MAFCKFCGNEIPDGTTCPCQGAQNSAVQNDPFDNGNQGGGAAASSSNNSMKGLIALAVAAIVVILLLIFVAGHTGAKGAARKFAKAYLTSKKGGKTYYSMVLDNHVYKDLKEDDNLDDMIEEFNDDQEDTFEDYKYKIKDIKKKKKLSKKQLKGAEIAFAFQNIALAGKDADIDLDDIKAKKGYIFKVKYKVKDKDDGDTDTHTQELCVVKFKGQGWKVIYLSDADELKNYGENYDKYENKF